MKTSGAEILEHLNPAQREAVLHERGPLLILAGAGSGKTRVITHRIAHLIRGGHRADGILAITFTNKAAGEMKERTKGLCGLDSPWISTFHSFAARLLRRSIHRLSPYDNSFSIYDTDDCRSLIKQILKDLRIDSGLWTPQAAQSEISRLKNEASENIDELFGAQYVYGQTLRSVFHAYSERMQERNAVDFDDLLLLSLRLLREHEDVLERYREQFSYVLVDEYQDTNAIQYRITQLLCAGHRNICITGDPDQSIYRWRGADISNILNFEEDYPDARVIKLEQNYRSSGNILAVSNALIEHNRLRKAKSLWTQAPAGDPVRVYSFVDERQEAREIVLLIGELLADGRAAGDVAVFYRLNNMSRPIEEELIYANIPYSIVGGVEFFLRREVKDLLAYIQLLDNPRDDESLKRVLNVPARGVGKGSLAKLMTHAREHRASLLDTVVDHAEDAGLSGRALAGARAFGSIYRGLAALRDGPVGETLAAVIELSGYESYLESTFGAAAMERVTNMGELVNSGKEYDRVHPEGKLTGFLENVRLLGNVDRWAGSADRVTLMTMHAAKGLEFPIVIIAGLEDGILPLLRADDPDPDIEEERRLLYVGATRAEECLYMTHASNRMRFGQVRRSTPSRFLAELKPTDPVGPTGDEGASALELDPETVESLLAQDSGGYAVEAAGAIVTEDFCDDLPGDDGWEADEDPYPVGARVEHEDYGEGEVVRTTGFGRLRRVTIAFESAGQKQFVAEYAALRRVR